MLNIHIEENHDPLILARRDRGEKTVSIPFYFFVVMVVEYRIIAIYRISKIKKGKKKSEM